MGLVNLRKATVLVALAEDASRVTLEDVLKTSRFTKVISSRSAVSTIELLKQNRVDILICDLDFNDIPGFELIKAAKAGYKKMGIIAIAKSITADRKDQVIACGAHHVFDSAIESNKLIATLESLMMQRMGIASSGVVTKDES